MAINPVVLNAINPTVYAPRQVQVEGQRETNAQKTEEPDSAKETKKNEANSQNTQPENLQGLTEEEKIQLLKLKQRDLEVRTHERAHIISGGQLVRSGARFQYQIGPDGHLYAIGGEVSIDTSPVPGDPEATIRKMQKIRGAALAPVQPSPQDRSVAAQSSQVQAKAQMELLQQHAEEWAAANQALEESNKDAAINEYFKNTDQADQMEQGSIVHTVG